MDVLKVTTFHRIHVLHVLKVVVNVYHKVTAYNAKLVTFSSYLLMVQTVSNVHVVLNHAKHADSQLSIVSHVWQIIGYQDGNV